MILFNRKYKKLIKQLKELKIYDIEVYSSFGVGELDISEVNKMHNSFDYWIKYEDIKNLIK